MKKPGDPSTEGLFPAPPPGRNPELLRLHDPRCADHVVSFYEDDSCLVEQVSYLAAKTFAAGDSTILLARDARLDAVHQRLARMGLERDALEKSGRYFTMDAARALSQFHDGRNARPGKIPR